MRAAGLVGDPSRTGTVLGERYELVERLAAGGGGTVYRGWDRLLCRDVAVKLQHRALAGQPPLRRRFLAEALVSAGLAHPNVVTVYDHGEDGLPYIVLEYVDGPSLRAVLNERGKLSPGQALTVLLPACAALSHAHAKGVLHRDVKPENILVTRDDQIVKVADFGIAKALDVTPMTASDQVVLGTTRYLAPELLYDGEASPATDQYALGVVAYELLTGLRWRAGSHDLAELAAEGPDRPPLVPSDVPGVDPVLDGVVGRATATSPRDRFPDLTAMAEALAEAVVGGRAPPLAVKPLDADLEVVDTTTSGFRSRRGVRARRPPRERRPKRPSRELGGNPPRVVTALAVLGLLLAVALPLLLAARSTRLVAVPHLAGFNEPAAREALEAAGLQVEIGEPVASAVVPPGGVVTQQPDAGDRVPLGEAVRLRLSSGDPVDPVEPGDPVEPADSVDPVDPVDPVEPVEPLPEEDTGAPEEGEPPSG